MPSRPLLRHVHVGSSKNTHAETSSVSQNKQLGILTGTSNAVGMQQEGPAQNPFADLDPVENPPLSSAKTPLVGGEAPLLGVRAVAVGDIHGDVEAFKRALRIARVLCDGNYSSGDSIELCENVAGTTVVQIGDLVNEKSNGDTGILKYMVRLEKSMVDSGGSVTCILGDHDLANLPTLWPKATAGTQPLPTWVRVAFISESTLFVHGSLEPHTLAAIRQSTDSAAPDLVEKMNIAARAWVSRHWEKPAAPPRRPPWLGAPDGPVWSRSFSQRPNKVASHCAELGPMPRFLNVKRIVIGHTVRAEGISSICSGNEGGAASLGDGKGVSAGPPSSMDLAWRIDVGLARTEGNPGRVGASQVLELSQGQTHILETGGEKVRSWLQKPT